MNNYEVLQFDHYTTNVIWIFFCIIIIFSLILFFKLMISKKKNIKEVSPDVLEKAYKNDFKNAAERISKSENQWQLDNAVYSISRFQKTYSKVKDRLSLDQDVNKLIKIWDNRKESIELTQSLFSPQFS
ncbi:MAG: hypothetical protein IPJ81_16310 [Chitinophagaceae bacterium]|nr:hypothetical protein [Chitinophagaceae bacterium]